MPTRQEIDLTRLAIDRGLLTVNESVECLKIQRDYDQAGQPLTLESIFLERKLLTDQQLASLRENLAKAAALHRIGHYEILSKVGAGGMGTVFRAKDLKADRIVALKVLSPGHASNKEYIERFLREAKAVGHLSHPNIVQGYDAGESGGQYYFAMEFIDGTTVGEMLRDGRPIPEQQALDIAIQIAKALEHAEQHGLVHRDIKPDNIMITKDGTAKLADLGLAKLMTGEPGAPERKHLGTAYYAAPEQCTGSEEVDSKSDMYAFGASLFHMLAGRVPFDGETPAEIVAKHTQEKPDYLKDINVQLSHGVSKIVRKLMAKTKRERYPDMGSLVRDLTLVRMGRSPKLGERSRHDSGEYRYKSSTGTWRTKPAGRRSRVTRIALAVGVGCAVLAVIWAAFHIFTPSRRGPADNVRTTGSARVVRPAHQIYYEEEVLRKRGQLSREEFLKRLRGVSVRYPGTESAKEAEAEAAKILEEMETEAAPVFRECRAAALALRDDKRYQAALERLDQFPPGYAQTRLAAELADLRKGIRDAADAEFRQVRANANALLKDRKFTEAIEVYRVVRERFDIPALKAEADVEVNRIREAWKDDERRAADELKRKEREEAIRKDNEALRAGLKDIGDFVRRSKFDEAAEGVQALAARLTTQENKDAASRTAADLAELTKLLALVKQGGSELKGKAVVITLKDNSDLSGEIFSAGPTRLSLECTGKDGKSIRAVTWDNVSATGLRAIAEARLAGKWTAAQRQAVAALLWFSDKRNEAKSELTKLGSEPDQKNAADARLKDYERFGQE